MRTRDPLTAQVFDNGSAHVIDGGLSSASDSTVVSLDGGQHYPVPVTAGAIYEIDADSNVRVKQSGSAATYKMPLSAGDNCRVVGQDLSSLSDFDFGTGGFSVEWWGTIDAALAANANHRVFSFGGTGGPSIECRIGVSAADLLSLQFRVESDDNSVLVDATTGDMTGVEPSTSRIRHVVWVADRDNDDVNLYLDGVLIHTESSAFADSDTVDITTLTGTGGRLLLGQSITAGGDMDGSTIALRVYDAALTTAQVQSRNGWGPNQLPTDGRSPIGYVDMALTASWADPGEPEFRNVAGDVLLTLNTVSLTDDIAAITGDAVASTANSYRIRGGTKKNIVAADDYINLYAEAAGDVIVTPL